MADCFYQVTAQGAVGREAIDNVFWVKASELAVTDPTALEIFNCVTAFRSELSTPIRLCMPTDYTLVSWHCVPFQSDGTPGTGLPQTLADGGVGALTPERDGLGNVAIFRASLGARVVLQPGASLLRRGYLAFGPLQSGSVSDMGAFSMTGAPAIAALLAALAAPLTLATIPHYDPIRVSMVASHVITHNITAWRGVNSWGVNSQARHRNSRTNGR